VTNRQSNITPADAFRTLGCLLGGLAALAVCVWYVWGADSSWDAVGAIVWAYLGKSLVDSGVRRVLVLGRQEQERAQRQADNTGVWRAAEAGTFTVRFEPETGVYWLSGWIEPNHELTSEVAYASAAGVASIVEEAEREGMVPEDNEATRAIRARLQVQGWDGPGLGIWPVSN
jgi:hypothetical protein